MKEYKVGIIGGTGMVGQRFITLMENHPWFRLTVIAASARSARKPYGEAAEKRWVMPSPHPRLRPGSRGDGRRGGRGEDRLSGGFLLLRC